MPCLLEDMSLCTLTSYTMMTIPVQEERRDRQPPNKSVCVFMFHHLFASEFVGSSNWRNGSYLGMH